MAKSRNRSRDARKRAAKKRKNREYQERKRESINREAREIAALTSPKVVETYNDLERNDGTRQQDS